MVFMSTYPLQLLRKDVSGGSIALPTCFQQILLHLTTFVDQDHLLGSGPRFCFWSVGFIAVRLLHLIERCVLGLSICFCVPLQRLGVDGAHIR